MKNQEPQLRLETCYDCYVNSVVVEETHEGSAYCTECMTNERLKETKPKLYKKAMKGIKDYTKK